jgi:thiol-disulfide isomerase/thioredoxin
MKKYLSLIIVLAVIGGAIYYLESQKAFRSTSGINSDITIELNGDARKMEKAREFEVAKEISTPDGFINTDDINITGLIGKKVILLDIWTYSCINCQRTLPYINAWYEKYQNQGLEIIGLHTPEFEFEKNYSNVVKAVERFGIKHPVVLDNDYSTWQAYKNQYWPRKYLIDIDGFIVYDHIGEGAYDETEKKIQELLLERKLVLASEEEVSMDMSDPKITRVADPNEPRSPETYFGTLRNRDVESDTSGTLAVHTLYLDGSWTRTGEFAMNTQADDKIAYVYRAKEVYLVAGADNPVQVKIFQDGKLYQELTIQEERLYEIIKDDEYSTHELEIEILSPGLKAFAFTFG